MLKIIKYWKNYRRFKRLPEAERALVFYSEGQSYWPYLEPIIRYFLNHTKQIICCVTSDKHDPSRSIRHDQFHCFLIGSGIVRTVFFNTLSTKVLVMSTPDLNLFHIKRSVSTKHYAYIHHSAVSCHMAYRNGAFDHFDSIFCVGPYHKVEIRALEKMYKLKEKQLIEHGYGRLDTIIDLARSQHYSSTRRKSILVAPSWGDHSLLEKMGDKIIDLLLKIGDEIIIRPHPETWKRKRKLLNSLIDKYKDQKAVVFERGINSLDSLFKSYIMISDWSGAAFDYVFGLEKPVIFIDVPRKINNSEYEKINIEPIEVTMRDKMGTVVKINELDSLTECIDRVVCDVDKYRAEILQLRSQHIYNIGRSAKAAAEELLRILEKCSRI